MMRVGISVGIMLGAVLMGCSGSPVVSDDSGSTTDLGQRPDALDATAQTDIAVPLDITSLPDATAPLDAVVADQDIAPDVDPCPAPNTMCGSVCLDAQTDVHNCGGCGVDCTALPGVNTATITCVAGGCDLVGGCVQGRGHCTTNPSDGCETDLTTPAHCGTCSTTCVEPVPMCTMAMTDGGVPTRQCASGCSGMTPTRCAGMCINPQTDPANCGGCGRVCPAVSEATPTCAGASCGILCNAGFHLCGGRCASNTDPATCGMACAPCSTPTNATPTCDGTTCGFACNPGFHVCGTTCASNLDPATCGAACTTPCPVPLNATATCNGTACGFACNTGFHLCAGQCVANANVASCGSLCTPCTTTTNGSATCDGMTCGLTCNTGYHVCGTSCLAVTSPTACGTSCTPCPVPTHGSATCDGTTCGVTCPSGDTLCGSACVNLTSDATNCGVCGHVCATGLVCVTGTCVSPPGCGASNLTVTCGDGTSCVTNSTCLGGGACTCAAGYTPVTCAGAPCRGTCTSPNWWCVPITCGNGNFNVPCSDGTSFCPNNSTCETNDSLCDCNAGYTAVSCGGVACSAMFCPGPYWWCRPN